MSILTQSKYKQSVRQAEIDSGRKLYTEQRLQFSVSIIMDPRLQSSIKINCFSLSAKQARSRLTSSQN